MQGHCSNCNKHVQGVKKQISWGWGWLTGWIPYVLYRWIFVGRDRCPICGLKINNQKIAK